jgi:hypothetical protein
MSLLKSKTTTSSNLEVYFDEPIKIDLSVTPVWKRNAISDDSKALYNTEGANYAKINGVDLDGVSAEYRISETVWNKCIESGKDTVYIADDGRAIQLVLPSTGSPRILAKLAAMRNAKLGVQTTTATTITPQGDADAPF